MKERLLKMPRLVLKDLNIQEAFNSFIGLIRLDKKVIMGIAKDEKGGAAAAFFLLLGVAFPWLFKAVFGTRVFNVIVRPDFSTVFINILIGLHFVLVAIFIVTVVATELFKGKGSFDDFFRVSGLAYGLLVLSIVGSTVPVLASYVALILLVWGFVILFVLIRTVFGLDDANTVLTILLMLVSIFVLDTFFSWLGLTAGHIGSIDFSSFPIAF